MPPTTQAYVVYYPIALAITAYVVYALHRQEEKPVLDWCVVALAIATYVGKTVWFPPNGWDLLVFHDAGVSILHGKNPYINPSFLNPPPGLPLLRIFGVFDFSSLLVLWTVFNSLVALSLVPIATLAVGGFPRSLVALVATVVALSIPVHFVVTLGQLSLWTGLFGIGALAFGALDAPWAAGVAVALAAIKPQNALPLLVRFVRGRLWLAWPAAAFVVLLLTWMSGPLDELLPRVHLMQENIARLTHAGELNDFSDRGPHPYTIIGFERWLWCWGVHDLLLARGLGLVLTAASGIALIVNIAKSRIDGRAAAALTAIYSLFFMYHRTGDSVVLALPLAYLAAELRRDRFERLSLNLSFIALIVVLVLHPRVLERVASGLPSFLGNPLVLPLPTTLLMLAGALIFFRAQRQKAAPADA
jgi:hypothetical protein